MMKMGDGLRFLDAWQIRNEIYRHAMEIQRLVGELKLTHGFDTWVDKDGPPGEHVIVTYDQAGDQILHLSFPPTISVLA
jgi:hypothetical protein